MKPQIIYIIATFLTVNLTFSQVLFSEDFDSLVVGDLSTDLSGNTSGQGGWYISVNSWTSSDIRIVAEQGRGNVLLLEYPANLYGKNEADKKDLNIDWSQRNPSNNVIKIEYDFFTGNETIDNTINDNNYFLTEVSNFNVRLSVGGVFYIYYPYSSIVSNMTLNPQLRLPKNIWIQLVMYLDYSNNKVYYTIPSLNIQTERVLISNNTLPVTIDNYPPESFLISVAASASTSSYKRTFISKYDNINISAVSTVPNVGINEVLTSKFNIFPNPVNDVVTITNSENIGIEEIAVYDVNGKMVRSQKSKSEKEEQLNMADFSAGTYLLHIKTNEGTAVKKVVKK